MRSPSRFVLVSLVSTLTLLTLAGSAAANGRDQARSLESSAFESASRVAVDDAFAATNARIDERLAVALSGPTTMECSNDLQSGFETCVVRTHGTPSSIPASLAQN
jgi:hypothetical protein